MDRQSFLKGCLAGLVAGAFITVIVGVVTLRLLVPESTWRSVGLNIRHARAESDAAMLGAALETYKRDFGRYPTQSEGLAALVDNPKGKYVGGADLPSDPWERPYFYRSPGPNGEAYAVISYGADGNPGGEGEDADVVSAAKSRADEPGQ